MLSPYKLDHTTISAFCQDFRLWRKSYSDLTFLLSQHTIQNMTKQNLISNKFIPTEKQAESLTKIFGCSRFVYNQLLSVLKESKLKLEEINTEKILSNWRDNSNLGFLSFAPIEVLRESLRQLRNDYSKTGDVKQLPFKSRRAEQSAVFPLTCFYIKGQKVKLLGVEGELELLNPDKIPNENLTPALKVIHRKTGEWEMIFN